MASKLTSFLAEFRRRKVGRVAVVYVAAGLAVIEAANNILPELGMGWLSRTVVLLVLLGLPIALLLSWALDLTPEGIRRTRPMESEDEKPGVQEIGNPTRVVLAAVVFVVLLGTSYFVLFRERGPQLHEDRVAVMQFTNRTRDPALDILGVMTAEWLTDGLSRADLVEVVPSAATLLAPERVGRALEDPNQLKLIAEGTGAGLAVAGSYFLERDSLRFQAQLLDTKRQRVLGSVQVSEASDRRIEAIESLREQVMGILAFHVDPRLSEIGEPSRVPPTYESYRAYVEEGERFIRADFGQAIGLGYRAFELDTTFLEPLLIAAAAHVNLDEVRQADSLVGVVRLRRDELAPAGRAVLDYLGAFVTGDLQGVLPPSREWVRVAPGFGQALGQLAWAALIVNRPREALEATKRVDPSWWSVRTWAPYWDYLTAAHHMLGQHRRELHAARVGRDRLPGVPSGRRNELRALAALGRVDEVRSLLEESLTHSRGEYGQLARVAAGELRAHGRIDVAQEILEQAISAHPGRTTANPTAVSRFDLAETLYLAERWEEAEAMIRDLAQEFGDRVDILGYLAVLAARKGDREVALRFSDQLARSVRPYLFGRHTYWRGRVAAQLGEGDRAIALLLQAHAEGYQFGLSWHTDIDLEPLRRYASFQEFMRPKG